MYYCSFLHTQNKREIWVTKEFSDSIRTRNFQFRNVMSFTFSTKKSRFTQLIRHVYCILTFSWCCVLCNEDIHVLSSVCGTEWYSFMNSYILRMYCLQYVALSDIPSWILTYWECIVFRMWHWVTFLHEFMRNEDALSSVRGTEWYCFTHSCVMRMYCLPFVVLSDIPSWIIT